jgi:hypothetical protein
MKQFAVILLTSILCVAALAACQKKESQPSSSAQSPEIPVEIETKPLPVPRPEPEPEPDPGTPEGAMSGLLDSAKEWDAAAIGDYLPEGSAITSLVPAEFEGVVSSLLSRTEYTVLDSETNGDAATVEVELTAVDAGEALEDAISGIVAEIAMGQLTGEPIDDYAALIDKSIQSIDVDDLPTRTTTATAYMTRGADGDWELDTKDTSNLPFLNAATGGAMDVAQQLTDLATTYGIKLR